MHHLARCIPYHVCCYSNSEPSINCSLKKTRSLRTRAMYLVINLTTADMFVRGFSHFSLFALILLDQMHATIRPYTALRHRLIKK